MSTPNPAPIIALLEKFRRDELRKEAAVLKQLGTAYAKLYERMSAQIELEVRRIIDGGGDSISRTYINSRLANLTSQIEDELSKYSAYLETTIDANTDDFLRLGAKHASDLLDAFGVPHISVPFDQLNTEQINTIVGFLSPGSPLRDRLDQLAGYNAPIIRDQLVEAIALGYNPYKTSGMIAPYLTEVMNTAKNGFASVLASAVRIARTSQLYTYREAQRANYQANSDVVSGWQWYASLDNVCCMSCVAMHGSIHPLDETLNDHHNGRCTPLPVVNGKPFIEEDAGQKWFESLPEEQQKDMMGPGAFQAWQDGKFDISDMSKTREDDVYGEMRTVTPLGELLEGGVLNAKDNELSELGSEMAIDKANDKEFYSLKDYERAVIYSDDGRVIADVTGKEHDIDLSEINASAVKDASFVHNHPSEDLSKGVWTFTLSDIQAAVDGNMLNMIATGDTKIYIMTRPSTGWADFEKSIKDAQRVLKYSDKYVEDLLKYRDGVFGDSPDALNRAADKFWKTYAELTGATYKSLKHEK